MSFLSKLFRWRKETKVKKTKRIPKSQRGQVVEIEDPFKHFRE